MCSDLTQSDQVVVVWRRRFVLSRDYPSGGIHTTRILEDFYRGSLSMCSSLSCVFRERWSLFFSICHFPSGSQLSSRWYHFVSCTLTFPPVSLAAPNKILRPYWASFTVSWVGVLVEGDIWTIVESSTNHCPTRFVVSPDMGHLKAPLCPSFLK